MQPAWSPMKRQTVIINRPHESAGDRERSGGVCDLFEKAARKWTCGEQSCMIAGPFPVPIGEKNKGPTIWRADLEERGQDVLHGRERRGGEGVERVNQCDFPLFHHGF